ncbi:VCBS repeat-containing protein [candidate division WOR-3 bacterium]|nr:VCBS repeat-containing protein [candidate division WOR-3 bacterium]
MTPTVLAVLLASLAVRPGAVLMKTTVDPAGSYTEEVVACDDTVIDLSGRWGVAVNAGNLDDDPALEVVCRLSKPAPSDLNITKLVVFDDDLSFVWSDTWGYSGNPEMPSVTLADLDRDGRDDIIVPMAETFFSDPPNYKCRIYALEGMTGAVKPGWPFIMPGWPEDPYHDSHSEVAAADVNGDDTVEVVVHVEDIGSIRKPGAGCYVLRADGDSLWKYLFYSDTLDRHGSYTSPAVADIDGDGRQEIICHTGWFQRAYPYPLIERRLFILNSDGTLRRSWQTEGAGAGFTPDYSSPAAADIDADGAPEIIFCRRTGWLDCYDTSGTMLPGFPVNLTIDARYYPASPMTRAFATPAVADVNADGRLEIICGTSGRQTDNSRWSGRVHVFRNDGTPQPGFPYTTRNAVWYSPAVANLDFGCGLEIATSGCDSAFYVVSNAGDSLPGWPLRHFPTYWLPDVGSYAFLEGIIPMSRTPFIADIDADNLNEILMAGRDGRLYSWDSDGPTDSTTLPCPTFRFNKQRTGCYRHVPVGIAENPGRVPSRLRLGSTVVRAGAPVELSLSLSTPQAASVGAYDCSGRLVGTLFTGALGRGSNELRLSTAGLAPGVYVLGTSAGPRARLVVVR